MANINFYTPDGVQDILYDSCELKRNMENDLRMLFRSFAYREIETPALEYIEVFSAGNNVFAPESMFKVFDEKGKVLVLKPDQTIPVARVAASKLKNIEDLSKVSYITNTYRFAGTGAGRLREFTQAGCELLNVPGPYADAEMMAIAVNSMLASGIKDFQIDMGQVDFFKGLMEESGLDDAKVESIRVLIDRKDYLGLEETLDELDMQQDLKDQILDIPSYFGDIEILDRLKKMVKNKRALKALENVEQIYAILKEFGLDKYISLDLGMVRSINYYTGLIFKGYTYGIGFPVLNGGRYDMLLDDFGVSMPAVGFSVSVNMLVMAVSRQDPDRKKGGADTCVSYEKESAGTAYRVASVLRGQGLCVECDLSPVDFCSAREYSVRRRIPGLVYINNCGKIEIVDNTTNEVRTVTFDELAGGGA
jgi:ATP phosphoribosyltransferase regulatory subunit